MADEDSAFRRPEGPSEDTVKTPSAGQAGRKPASGAKSDPDGKPAAATKRSRLRNKLRNRLGPNLMTAGILVLCGFMVSWAALASHGSDFRPETDDMSGLVRDQASHNADQAKQVAELRAKVDQLSKTQVSDPKVAQSIDALSPRAGLTAVSGNAVRVTLDDAPLDVKADGIDENLLVVHQQDIQMVANVLWSGGAEAMTIQGQRITSATGIKCVGNTVVLHGVPYAPPYRIEAIGDVDALNSALAESESVRIYREYVTAYRLGWKVENLGTVTMPAFKGSLGLTHATPVARK